MARDVLAGIGLGLVVGLIAACESRPPGAERASADLDDEPPLEALGSIRRPATTYRMIRTGERCEVVLEQSGQEIRRLPKKYACPKYLELGEWIRITGMVCVREGAAVERPVPVPCPDYLTNAERDHRLELAKSGRSTLDPEPPPTAASAAPPAPSATPGP